MPKTTGYYMDDSEPEFHSETSVEKALNSRCSSDTNTNQLKAHWGLYNPDKLLLHEHTGAIMQALQIPRFTNMELSVDLETNPIVLSIPAEGSKEELDFAHIESGMQQQAIHLVCAALGMGVCIKNIGVNGKILMNRCKTVKMHIEMMHPSYGGSFWSISPPENWCLSDSLSEPCRDSGFPLLKAIEDAATSAEGETASSEDISQLLWAARGRTPHYVFGECRGLTIPIWAGGLTVPAIVLSAIFPSGKRLRVMINQYSSLYMAHSGKLRLYDNGDAKTSRHALTEIAEVETNPSAADFLLAVNESNKRALWEVGYMLENLILQAVALGVGYKAVLCDDKLKNIWAEKGINNVCAIFSVKVRS